MVAVIEAFQIVKEDEMRVYEEDSYLTLIKFYSDGNFPHIPDEFDIPPDYIQAQHRVRRISRVLFLWSQLSNV